MKPRFSRILDVGSGRGHLIKFLDQDMCDELVQLDTCQELLMADEKVDHPIKVQRVLAKDEHLPFKENEFDMVTSNLSLHWENDLPGVMVQVIHLT